MSKHNIELLAEGRLEFNSHVHAMVTTGGLHRSTGTWVPCNYVDGDLLMEAWRRAVIPLLRAALSSGRLSANMSADELETPLSLQEKRWWRIKIQFFKSKAQFPVCRSLCKTATDRAVPHYFTRKSQGHILVQGQGTPATGLRALFTGTVRRVLGAACS